MHPCIHDMHPCIYASMHPCIYQSIYLFNSLYIMHRYMYMYIQSMHLSCVEADRQADGQTDAAQACLDTAARTRS